MSEDCRHGMNPDWCADCRPGAATESATGPFVWIKPARYYHAPTCSEVLWDPTQAKRPGERVDLEPSEVRALLRAGLLDRGCLKCGALA